MKFNLFTFLKDNKIYTELKLKVVDLIKIKKEVLKTYAEDYIYDKSPLAKEFTTTYIMEHIKLGFPYNLFKGKIKKVLNKNFDKLVEFILEKVQEV